MSHERSLQWGRAVRRASLVRRIGVGDVSFAPRNLASVKSSRWKESNKRSICHPEHCRIETRDYFPVGERQYSKTPVLDGKRAAGELRNQAERASSNMCDHAVYARDQALALAKTDQAIPVASG